MLKTIRRHPRWRTCLLTAVLLASACGLAGCGVKVRVQEASPGLDDALSHGAVVAVLGVVAAPAVGVLNEDDAAAAADALTMSLAAGYATVSVRPAPATADLLGQGRVDSLLAQYARLGTLQTAPWRDLSTQLAGVQFLAVAAIEDDAVETHTSTVDQTDPAARAQGLPEHASPWDAAAATERKTTANLALIRVADGLTAWRGTARVEDRIHYEYDSPQVDPRQVVERANDADEPGRGDEISRFGRSVQAPDLVELLRRAFTELVTKLPGASVGPR